MKIDVITLFPELVKGGLSESIIKRATDSGYVTINTHNLRDFTVYKHNKVDDTPYGGGAGLVIQVDPVKRAIEHVNPTKDAHVIYFTPRGKRLDQKRVKELAQKKKLVMLCGHYEGFDQRIIDNYVDEEISIGDFILTGGELAATLTIDATVRLLDGVLGRAESHQDESFEDDLLEYPHYSKPADYEGCAVPDVLLSGHHQNIEDWRYAKSLEITYERRRDLFDLHISHVLKRQDQKEYKRLHRCLRLVNLELSVPIPIKEKRKRK
jgi:tRNA (guanine37-N1)-methyltransferase